MRWRPDLKKQFACMPLAAVPCRQSANPPDPKPLRFAQLRGTVKVYTQAGGTPPNSETEGEAASFGPAAHLQGKARAAQAILTRRASSRASAAPRAPAIYSVH